MLKHLFNVEFWIVAAIVVVAAIFAASAAQAAVPAPWSDEIPPIAHGEVRSIASDCHCGANCLCSPCTGNCSVVERLEAEFLAKHPGQKSWIKTGAGSGAKALPSLAVSAPTYTATECRIVNGKRVCGPVSQPAAKSRTGQSACQSCQQVQASPQVQYSGWYLGKNLKRR